MAKRKVRQLAMVDSSVLLRLGVAARNEGQTEKAERTLLAIQKLQAEDLELVVPAPAYAELGDGDAAAILDELGSVYVYPFDFPVAEEVGRVIRAVMQGRPEKACRVCLKTDLMIAAVAHKYNAKYLVTTDPRDFKNILISLKSRTEVYNVDNAIGLGQGDFGFR